ncbi:hypothetical protein KIM372_13150 [Bombiscardovia nodaiensis]|uniref:DNA 3'-5' helicase n=1 Tax=Bombiscardovia nodaiensis TaxID=2932181 RepID=A0ABM8B9H6_9BIFI|nr:hypothetical protein KIM372_13150 [Bombiscardovia nodaiensis]
MKYTPEQSKIIKASTDDDLLVVAGAGSGKTMTMTSRIVSLIERGVPAESILGLTFTNKAASELLSRVSAAVASQSASGSWDPNRAFLKPEVSTYDAFFQSIVRQYGLLVGMDQGTQPLSEAGAVQLAANVVKEHLDSIFPRQSERLEEALAEEGQADSLGADGSEELGAFDTAVQQVLALSRALSNAMISRDCPSFEDAVGRVRAWDQAFIARLDALIGSEVVPEQAPSASSIKLPKRTKKDTDQTYADKLGRMRQHRQDYRLFQADRLRRLVRKREQLLTLVGYYQEAKRQAEMAEFSDFTLAAFQLVTRFPSIGAIYRRRFTHVFLDEYQDTSTTQALLLAAIFHPQNRSGAEEQTYAEVGGKVGQQAGPHRSAVTAVGDPFQSIYAWRGASPGAFATFLNEFGMDSASPQAKLSLSQTFRNAHLVLDAANHLTDYLRADHEPQGPRPSARLHEVDVQELLARDDADQGTLGFLGYQSLGQEVDGVVRFVKQANATYGQTGPSGVDKGAPHVAVLFRSKKNMPTYQQALEDAGLSVQVVGYSALFDRPEIEDLLALLRVLCDHTNSAALMRLLASPRFNLTPGDLTAFANLATRLNTESLYQALVQRGVVPAGLRGSDMSQAIRDHRDRLVPSVFLVDLLQQDDLPELLASRKAQAISPRGKQLLLKAAQVLAQAQAQSSAPLRQAVLAASRALGLDIDLVVAQALRAPTDPIDASSAKASLGAFFEQVDAYAQELPQGLSASLRGFVSWIDAMRQSPNEPTSGLDTHVDVVLMTIHQAKGLEWDAVAVVGMGKGTFPSSQGDHLKIELVDPQEASSPTPAYQSTARTWLTDPTAVPVPIRADAQILPQFPHDAPPEESLGTA